MTKSPLILSFLILPLAGCQLADQTPVPTAAEGALSAEAPADQGAMLSGALVGAAEGVVAQTRVGPAPTPGFCFYLDQKGTRYIAAC